MGFYDDLSDSAHKALDALVLDAENETANLTEENATLTSQLATASSTIAGLKQELASEQSALNFRVLTTSNPWIDQTPNDGSPQPSTKPVIVQDADGTQIAVTIPNGSSLFVRKFGPQPGIQFVSYCFNRQYKGTGKLKLWESDLIITEGGKKWNGSFQLRFDLGTIQIWGPTAAHPGGTWVDTGLKHGITDPTKLTSIQINFQKRPDGIFYDSVVINGLKFLLQTLMPLENTPWANQFLLQLQFMLDSGSGEDDVSGITTIVA